MGVFMTGQSHSLTLRTELKDQIRENNLLRLPSPSHYQQPFHPQGHAITYPHADFEEICLNR